jgi:xylulokinase
MDKYTLALDLGTTAIKVAVVDMNGKIVSLATREYKLLTPDLLSVELPVDTYWEAFKAGVRKVLAKTGILSNSLVCLGISAQGETLIIVDKNGNPLRNAIVWMDNRAQKEAAELAMVFPPAITCKITGQVSIVPTWPASKLLWIKNHEPENFRKIYKVLLIEDYFIYRLTGKFACEGSLVCSTAYWDITTKKWWPEMLGYLGITDSQLPDIYEPGEVVAGIKTDVAKELGVSEKMTICTGALDQAAGTIGAGNIVPGLFSENTGAALAICATVTEPFVDPSYQIPCHYHGIRNLYMAHTFTTGGVALKWFRDSFCDLELILSTHSGLDSYYLMDQEVKPIPSGSEGLVMLPHLQGSMAPDANPKARGVYFGITMKHNRAHFIRAVMESIGYIVMRNIEAINALGIPVTEVRVLGGGSKSAVWNQIKADITGRVIWTTDNADAACLGAAILSGVSCGIFSGIKDAVSKMVHLKQRFEPDMNNHKVYQKLFDQYKHLYTALCPLFEIFEL